MRSSTNVPRIVFLSCCLACLAPPAAAAVNAFNLGASYDSTQSNVTFRVYSSRATRVEVDLYTAPMNSAEVLRVPMNADTSTNIFSVSIPVATLHTSGITTVYYGYRAWGPNWPYSTGWTKGSGVGFVADENVARMKVSMTYHPLRLASVKYAKNSFDYCQEKTRWNRLDTF